MEPSMAFVCAMGIGTVFIGLISLVIICSVIGLFCRGNKKQKISEPVATNDEIIENKQELIAAISAAVAEELGTDVSAIRITSFKKM